MNKSEIEIQLLREKIRKGLFLFFFSTTSSKGDVVGYLSFSIH
jgi:hypothetical protein